MTLVGRISFGWIRLLSVLCRHRGGRWREVPFFVGVCRFHTSRQVKNQRGSKLPLFPHYYERLTLTAHSIPSLRQVFRLVQKSPIFCDSCSFAWRAASRFARLSKHCTGDQIRDNEVGRTYGMNGEERNTGQFKSCCPKLKYLWT